MSATAVSRPARSAAAPGRDHAWALLLAPAVGFLGVFFLVPLVEMATRSVTEPSAHNYTEFFEASAYVRVLTTSFRTAALVTVCCLALAYPYAYAMRRTGRLGFVVLSAALLLPFWSSLLVRSFAWITLLQDTGVINDALTSSGITSEPLALIRNELGVVVGMTHILLPYMVLPLYAAMSRIDLGLVDAAKSLGAPPRVAFWRVFFPLTTPGLVAGSLLVFVLALGFYITPALLGGPQETMVGQLIADQVTEQVRFGFASAIGIVLLVVTFAVLGVGVAILQRAGVFKAVLS